MLHNFTENYFSEDGIVTTTFSPTPIMSSYLLAFVVSDLKEINNNETKESDDTLHRVWVRSDALSKAHYGLEISVAVLKTLEDYLGFKFELSEINSAGVPNKGGAMENWGMVIYRLVFKTSFQVSARAKHLFLFQGKRDDLRGKL